MGDATRWTVNVARETDIEVRTYLAQRGLKKGDLSRFIEDSVKWRLLDLTIAEVRANFDGVSATDMDELVDEALESVRRH